MEVKVWLDGYQRVVCGVTEQTTCQDVMIALAQATGVTGRYAMFEKWRNSEQRLLPADQLLVILRKWGEYSNDVQLILRHSSESRRKIQVPPSLGRFQVGGPPERASLKKSLTFSGVHRRAFSLERPAMSRTKVGSHARTVYHSVESSEQSSVASQSSASLSPYMSLERQAQRDHRDQLFGDLHTDELKQEEHRGVWQQMSQLSHVSKAKTIQAETRPAANPSTNRYTDKSTVRSQVPIPAVRHSKTSAVESGNRNLIPRNVNSQGQAKLVLPKKQFANGSISEIVHPYADVLSELTLKNVSDVRASYKTSSASSSSNTPTSLSLNSPADAKELCSESSLNSRNLVVDPVLRSPLPSPRGMTRGVNMVEFRDSGQAKNNVADRNMNLLSEIHPIKDHNRIKDTNQENELYHRTVTHRGQSTDTTTGINKTMLSLESADSSSQSSDFDSSSLMIVEPLNPDWSITRSDGASAREMGEKQELIELIGRQEEEIQKCVSHLKDLNYEISLLEGDLEIDEKHLETQMNKIEELELQEKEVENELEELELVSWDEKLELEKQKESRIQTEILLLQSSMEKSETEIQSCIGKIKMLTAKTEETAKELNRFREGKKVKEDKEINELEERLHQVSLESQMSEVALTSLEEEIQLADRSLSSKKEDLQELASHLKKVNLDIFLQEQPELVVTRRGRAALVDRLGLMRPTSLHRLQRCQLTSSSRQQNLTIEDVRNDAHDYVV